MPGAARPPPRRAARPRRPHPQRPGAAPRPPVHRTTGINPVATAHQNACGSSSASSRLTHTPFGQRPGREPGRREDRLAPARGGRDHGHRRSRPRGDRRVQAWPGRRRWSPPAARTSPASTRRPWGLSPPDGPRSPLRLPGSALREGRRTGSHDGQRVHVSCPGTDQPGHPRRAPRVLTSWSIMSRSDTPPDPAHPRRDKPSTSGRPDSSLEAPCAAARSCPSAGTSLSPWTTSRMQSCRSSRVTDNSPGSGSLGLRKGGMRSILLEISLSSHSIISPDLSSHDAGLISTGAGRCGEGILPVGYDSSAEVARGAGSTGPVGFLGSPGRAGWCSARDGERAQPGQAVEQKPGPGCVGGQV